MKLKDFMEEAGVSQAQLMAAADIKQGHASLLINDKAVPSLRVALAIHELSNGKVSLTDWAEAVGGTEVGA